MQSGPQYMAHGQNLMKRSKHDMGHAVKREVPASCLKSRLLFTGCHGETL